MFPLHDSVEVRNAAFVTWLLVLANVLCFLLQVFLPQESADALVEMWSVVPAVFIQHFGWLQIVHVCSSMFVHSGIPHIVGNMWFLWIFGDGVEDRIGHAKYLLLYFFSGVCAAFAQIAVDAHSQLPMVGASGAISGILGAYFVLFPRATVSTFVWAGLFSRIWDIPASFYLGLWFLAQIFSGLFALMMRDQPTGFVPIAFWAHVAGFVVGVVAAKIFCKDDSLQQLGEF